MGRASISIAITSNFNSRGIDAAIKKAEQLATSAVHYQGKFGKAAVDMGASMGQAAARLVSMGKSVADLGDRMTMGVTVPMGLAAAAAVASAAKIDTAWYNVRKTVDMTEEGYQRLKQGAMELAEVQPVSADTILNIESLGGQLGITNGYLEDFAKIVSGLDIATNMNSDEAATSLAQYRNIVQMTEGDLDNMASTIVDLGNHTATTEHDIMELALRFASAGHVAGMSNQEILGISAALAGLGMKAEAGGSALSRVINDIGIAVDTNGEHLEAWAKIAGRSVDDFKAAWKSDAAGTFQDILKGIASAGDEMNSVLDEAGVTQIRTSDAMRRLASSGDLMAESVERANRAWAENTALQREVDNRNESLQARWDTLVNRFTNDLARIGQPFAEIGLDALDGLEPIIQGIGDLTQAFASASPEVQRFTFNLAAVAMGAGPVLSVAGRLMQAFGNIGQAVGRGYQAWGRYREGLHSTDMSMITTLSNSQDLASQMGVSRNAIVKAAGGVETFNVAYRKTTDELRRNVEQQVRATAEQEAFAEAMSKGAKSELEATEYAKKHARSREVTAKVTKAQKEAIRELNDSIDESNVATKLNVQNVTEQEKAAEKASLSFGRMGDAIKGALLGLGGMALTGAAVAGVTWLVTQFQLAAERAENLRLATEGLHRSLSDTTESVNEQNRVWGSSISAVDEAIAKQAQLGQVFEENSTQAQIAAHSLDRAADAIRTYANHSGLSASEQYRLKSAIDTVNEACGTQYSLVDAANGKIADETGAVLENTDAILANVEARKKQIQTQAIEANYQAAYEQELTTKKALRDVQNEFNDAMQRYNSYLDSSGKLRSDLSKSEREDLRNILDNLGSIRDRLHEANAAAESATNETRYWESELDRVLESTSGIAENLRSDTDFSVAFDGIEDATRNIDAFAASTHDLGINIDALAGLGASSANTIAQAFDGTATSVVKAMEGIDEARYILDNIGMDWYNSFSSATQGIIGSVAAMKDMTLAELRALAVDMGVQGEQAVDAFMRAMDAGFDPGEAAKFAKKFDEAFDDSLDPEVAARAAKAFVQALADNLTVDEAIAKAQEIVEGMKSTLSGADFSSEGTNAAHTFFASFNESIQQNALDSETVWSDTGKAIGRILPDGTIQGINEGAANIPNAVQGMVDGAKPPLDSLGPYAEESARSAGERYGGGFQLGAAGAGTSADLLIQDIMGRLLGGVPQAEDAGTQTGQGYGNSVSGQGSVAEFAAMQTLGRLLQIWLLGIESARQAGTRTGTAYGEGTQTGFAGAAMAAATTVYNLIALLVVGVSAAATAGTQTGDAYARNLSTNLMNAATFADATVRTITTSLESGVEPARSAGTKTGDAFTNGMKDAASKAPGIANGISTSTGYAFGSGTGAASAAGAALGSAFASAVWTSGSQAISYARSIRNSVKDIFSNIPTANIRVNVQRTYSTAKAALPMQTPVMPVPATFGLTRAETVAERAVNRVAAARTVRESTSEAMGAAVSATASQSRASIDYDAMYRVVKQGVKAAIDESGGLVPNIELDGRIVSKQLAPSMDYELGQRDRRRGGRR